MQPLFPEFNFIAILVSGAAYWLLGALWFSVLAGNAWSTELEKHGVTIKEPTKSQLIKKLLTTLLLNILVAFGVSFMVYTANIQSVSHAIVFGLFLGICFSASTIGIAYTWESRSLKLFLIDVAYPVLGITVCTVILTLWQ